MKEANLLDEIMDQAAELAEGRILVDPTDEEIIDNVSALVNCSLHPKSKGAGLAVAQFRRHYCVGEAMLVTRKAYRGADAA